MIYASSAFILKTLIASVADRGIIAFYTVRRTRLTNCIRRAIEKGRVATQAIAHGKTSLTASNTRNALQTVAQIILRKT